LYCSVHSQVFPIIFHILHESLNDCDIIIFVKYNCEVVNQTIYSFLQELCKVPKLVVEGVTCDDLNEGELGNTWFVSACSSLAQEPKMWAKVRVTAKYWERMSWPLDSIVIPNAKCNWYNNP
jgi:hypothetical protein